MERMENTVVLTAEEYENLKKAAKPGQRAARLCCSKKLLIANLTLSVALAILVAVGVFFTDKDMTPLTVVAGLAWGVAGADVAVYSWKAKAENKIKLTQGMVRDMAEKYGIDAVVQLASITLNDN